MLSGETTLQCKIDKDEFALFSLCSQRAGSIWSWVISLFSTTFANSTFDKLSPSLRSKHFRPVSEQRTRNESQKPHEKWGSRTIFRADKTENPVPRRTFLGLSLLWNHTETLATQASCRPSLDFAYYCHQVPESLLKCERSGHFAASLLGSRAERRVRDEPSNPILMTCFLSAFNWLKQLSLSIHVQ